MKTKAAVLYETGKPLVVETLDTPSLKDGQCLVKIFYSGVCHSQLNEMNAAKGEDKYLPHTLGHEASGTIEEIGPKVTKVKAGDYVVASWIKDSGLEASQIYYTKGEDKINAGACATFSQYAVISENRLTKISNKIPKDVAALFGCPILTGGGMILNEINAKNGDSIAIFGIGGVGASALLVASSSRIFSEVIAVDINQKKLNLAKDLGATRIINAKDKDPVKEIFEITNGKGVDYSLETAGSKKAMESAFYSTKPGSFGKNGGLTIIAGNTKRGELIEIYPFDLIKGRRIKGSWGGDALPGRDLPIYEKMYLDGKFPINKLITREYSLEEINQSLKDLEGGEECRIVINLEK